MLSRRNSQRFALRCVSIGDRQIKENEMANEEETQEPEVVQADEQGVISDVGMLDLRYAKVPEDLAHIRAIKDVGLVLVPEHLAGVLAGISISDVGGVVPIPQDGEVKCLIGQSRITGAMLEAGDPEAILVIAGQAFITGEVKSVGYKEIRVFGQLFAPRSGEAAISAKLAQLNGQNFFLPSDARMFMGEETIGKEFLELLDAPTALVVMGSLTFGSDVTRELLKDKITEIVLMGTIRAQAELVALLQVLTKEKMGEITPLE
jgi:hypothetical protein